MRTIEVSDVEGVPPSVDGAGVEGSEPVVGTHDGRGSVATNCASWLLDRRVLDSTGDPIGISVAAYADAGSGRPTWLAVYTGRRTAVIVVVPVDGSSMLGDDILIAHDLDTVLAAPGDPQSLSDPTRQGRLSAHYRRVACRGHQARSTSATSETLASGCGAGPHQPDRP